MALTFHALSTRAAEPEWYAGQVHNYKHPAQPVELQHHGAYFGLYDIGEDVSFRVTQTANAKVDVPSSITLTGGPTGGTFTLNYNGQTTAGIAYNATASTVQAALEALSTVNPGDVLVTGSAGGPYTLAYGDAFVLRQDMQLTGNGSGLTPPGIDLHLDERFDPTNLNPADILGWELHDENGDVLHVGGAVATADGDIWSLPWTLLETILPEDPQGTYHVWLRGADSSINPGKWAPWGPTQGDVSFHVLDMSDARYADLMPRIPADEARVGSHSDPTPYRAALGEGFRLELRLTQGTYSEWLGACQTALDVIYEYVVPTLGGRTLRVMVTVADWTNAAGQAATVQAFAAEPLWDDPPEGVELVFIGTNEPGPTGAPEMGALGGGVVLTNQAAFRAAVHAGRPGALISTFSSVRIDPSTREPHADYFAGGPVVDFFDHHDYNAEFGLYGLDENYDGNVAWMTSNFPAYASLPRLIDEGAAVAGRDSGAGKPTYQQAYLLTTRFARWDALKMRPADCAYYYVAGRQQPDGYPYAGLPAGAHLMVDAQERADADPDTAVRIHCGGHEYAFRAQYSDRSDGTRLLAVCTLQAGAVLTLHLPGVTAGTVLTVRTSRGNRYPVTVAAGSRITLEWTNLSALYVGIPGGTVPAYVPPANESLVDPDGLGAEYHGPSAPGAQSYGSGRLISTVSGDQYDARLTGREAVGAADAPWMSPDPIDGVNVFWRVYLPRPTNVARVNIRSVPPHHAWCSLRAGTVVAPDGTPIASFDIGHTERVMPNGTYDAVVMSYGDGTAAQTLPDLLVSPTVGPIEYFDIVPTRATTGGAASPVVALGGGTVAPTGGGDNPLMRFGNGYYASSADLDDTDPLSYLALERVNVWERAGSVVDGVEHVLLVEVA